MMRALRVVWLVVIWLALWSEATVANLVSGLVVAVVVVGLFDTWRTGEFVFRPLRALKFLAYFLYKLVEASVVVARTVISPRHRLRSGIVAVPLSGCTDALATLIADAISLTPGTLTLEVRRNPLTLYVHVLHVEDVEEVRRDVRTLEVLAVEAFGAADAIAGLAVDDTRSIGRKG
jgi:multicomponent Na+:H+ antiporter subunit E